jgi:hypothetical protein
MGQQRMLALQKKFANAVTLGAALLRPSCPISASLDESGAEATGARGRSVPTCSSLRTV